ncbi:MAG: hypothetical protein HQM04_14885, partial [Magnetococcales bacterium]|nr:hypothetical protein [Magnetococcales bacterium]
MADHDGTYHQVYTDPHMVADLMVHFVNSRSAKINTWDAAARSARRNCAFNE